MSCKLHRAAWLATVLVGAAGCAAPRILGKATLVDENGAPVAGAPNPGVTVNFINLTGTIEESVTSVQTDPQGKYTSPELLPGKYSVEAALPGYAIEHTTVVLEKHGKKNAPFVLKKTTSRAPARCSSSRPAEPRPCLMGANGRTPPPDRGGELSTDQPRRSRP